MRLIAPVVALVVLLLIVASLSAGCGESAPAAAFAASPTTGEVPLEVQFTDESTGEVDTWAWDFDDDGSVDSTERNPSHTYETHGRYSVRLTVTGPGGSDTETKAAYLDLKAPTPAPCEAMFEADPTEGEGITSVQFTDLSTGDIVAWEWDFDGDGVVDSTEQNPEHTYTKNGDYTVTLTVTGWDCEDSLTRTDYIHMTGCPT
jgi:PKD repeat protein